MAQIVSAIDARPMCFRLRPLASDGGRDHRRWVISSQPELHLPRDGAVHGGQDEAERAARAAVADMGGSVEEAAR